MSYRADKLGDDTRRPILASGKNLTLFIANSFANAMKLHVCCTTHWHDTLEIAGIPPSTLTRSPSLSPHSSLQGYTPHPHYPSVNTHSVAIFISSLVPAGLHPSPSLSLCQYSLSRHLYLLTRPCRVTSLTLIIPLSILTQSPSLSPHSSLQGNIPHPHYPSVNTHSVAIFISSLVPAG